MSDFKPIHESYWVEPGRLLAGEHPGHWDERTIRRRLASLLDAGIRVFIDLSDASDAVHCYRAELDKLGRDRGLRAEYLAHPLDSDEVPQHAEDVRHILRAIQAALQAGERVYIHCGDGVGRTGMVAGCWLVESGFDPEHALDELARRFAAMGKSRFYRSTPSSAVQAEWVENWQRSLRGSLECCQAS